MYSQPNRLPSNHNGKEKTFPRLQLKIKVLFLQTDTLIDVFIKHFEREVIEGGYLPFFIYGIPGNQAIFNIIQILRSISAREAIRW